MMTRHEVPNGDAARAELAGAVGAKVSGGVIRYRSWPARRHPLRLALAAAVVVGVTVLTAVLLKDVFWPTLVLVGCSLLAAAFFFPTEVALDGDRLVIRRLGQPQSFELRSFRRIEVAREMMSRVELLNRARLSPMDPVEGIVLPLPDDPVVADQVLVHLRRWVGRTPTGRFKIDIDHAPEDDIH